MLVVATVSAVAPRVDTGECLAQTQEARSAPPAKPGRERCMSLAGRPDDSGAARTNEAGCRAGRKPEQASPGPLECGCTCGGGHWWSPRECVSPLHLATTGRLISGERPDGPPRRCDLVVCRLGDSKRP